MFRLGHLKGVWLHEVCKKNVIITPRKSSQAIAPGARSSSARGEGAAHRLSRRDALIEVRRAYK